MPEFELKTKSMLKVLQPIIDQITLHSSLESANHMENSAWNKLKFMIEEACNLPNADMHFEASKEKVEAALFTLDQNVGMINGEKARMFGDLLIAVCNVLRAKDLIEVETMCILVDTCQSNLVKVMKSTLPQEIGSNLKEFVDVTKTFMRKIRLYAHDLVSRKQQQVILLCASQIAKCLHWLKVALLGEADDMKLLKRYVYNCINWCFIELKNVVNVPKPTAVEENEGCGGQFIHRMDLALEMLSSSCGKLPDMELKTVLDDVLCHAMSIAQVAVASDRKIITAGCQKVLQALELLKKEHSSSESNPSMYNLYMNSLADSLESLERRVNTALLRLVLEVFSDFSYPRNALLQAVMSSDMDECDRHYQDLDEIIAVFDLQMDRIMQIGLFAMACSEDVKRVLGIRSCLASLESLEPELIPAMIAYYLEPSKLSSLVYLRALWQHWESEVGHLAVLIDGIVDPAAFCQVTLDDILVLVATMKLHLSTADREFLKKTSRSVSNKSRKFLQNLQISISEVEQQNIPQCLPKIMDDFCLVCKECDVAITSVLDCGKANIDLTERSRILKRFELLVSVLKKLQPLLMEMINHSDKEEASGSSKNVELYENGGLLQFPESVGDLAVDETSNSALTDKLERDVPGSNFAELLKKGKLLSKERSILYYTPKKEHLDINLKPSSAHRMQCRHINFSSRSQGNDQDVIGQSLQLEITSILEKLTCLSSTLTEKESSVAAVEEEQVSIMVDQFFSGCQSVEETPSEMWNNEFHNAGAVTELYSTGDRSSEAEKGGRMRFYSNLSKASHEINTPQRIQDLHAVQKRINDLMACH